MGIRAICAALIASCASCIIEETAPTRPERDFWSDEDAQDLEDAPPPPTRPAPPAKRPRAVTIPDGTEVARRNAARADEELDGESDAPRDRVVISNLDAKGEPIPGSTGAPGGSSDDAAPRADLAQGAPGANEPADALARAWPGARPIPLTEDGSAEFDEGADPEPPAAGTERDPGSFVQPLRSYGRWIDTPDQGRVWLPYVDNDWQPYTDGVWSDTEYGWAFTSYDPWGWAVWHYGAWGYRDGLGWYWQPGRTWGPAWVSWRWGGGYAAWRPIAPSGAGRGPAYDRSWVAVPAARFTEPLYNGALIRGQAARVAIARSKPIPNPIAVAGAGAPFGPPVAAVAQAVGHPVVAAAATQLVRESTLAARSAAANERRAPGRASFIAPSRSSSSGSGAARSTWREPNPDAVPHRRPQINYGVNEGANGSRAAAPSAHPQAAPVHRAAPGGAAHATSAAGGAKR